MIICLNVLKNMISVTFFFILAVFTASQAASFIDVETNILDLRRTINHFVNVDTNIIYENTRIAENIAEEIRNETNMDIESTLDQANQELEGFIDAAKSSGISDEVITNCTSNTTNEFIDFTNSYNKTTNDCITKSLDLALSMERNSTVQLQAEINVIQEFEDQLNECGDDQKCLSDLNVQIIAAKIFEPNAIDKKRDDSVAFILGQGAEISFYCALLDYVELQNSVKLVLLRVHSCLLFDSTK